MATVPGNSTSGLYGIGLSASTPVGNNYGNSNVAAFLTSYQGNLTAGQIVVQTGNISGANIVAGNYYWANGVTLLDTLYSDTSVEEFLPTYTGNIASTITEPTQLGIVAIGPQVNLTAASNVNIGNFWINNVQDPINAQDSATKNYVDSIFGSLNIRASVQYATAAALPPFNYYPGASGVGATISGVSNGLLYVDGYIPQVGDRVLVCAESFINTPYQGVYAVTRNNIGSPYQLTRSSDMDQPQDFYGAFVYVSSGSSLAGTQWVCTNSAASGLIVGTTPITFVDIGTGGGGGNTTLTAGDGINLGNSQINVSTDGVTTYINTFNQVAVDLSNYTGNLGGGYYLGNIAFAQGYNGANATSVVNGNSNVTISIQDGPITFGVGGIDQGYIAYNAVALGFEAGNIDNAGTGTVAIGEHTAQTNQGGLAIAIGSEAGRDSQGVGAVAVGKQAGLNTQGQNAVALGLQAGANFQGNQAIAIGYNAGDQQGQNSIAIGSRAGGSTPQVGNSIIIDATNTHAISAVNSGLYVTPIRSDGGNTTISLYYNTTTKEITYSASGGNGVGNISSLVNGSYTVTLNSNGTLSIPNPAGTNPAVIKSQQGSVSFGEGAGTTTQGSAAVAIGINAANTGQGASAVAIGSNSGGASQGAASVAIGPTARSAGVSGVAVGSGASSADQYATALGTGAVANGVNSIALGLTANAAVQSSIVINASGLGVVGNQAGLFVRPVRNDSANVAQAIYYNPFTYEMTYANATGGGGNVTAGNTISYGTTSVNIPAPNGDIIFKSAGANVGRLNVNQVALGSGAGDVSQAGSTVAIGGQAGQNSQSSYGVAIGSEAGYQTQQTRAVAIGYQAGYNTQGLQSVAIGPQSGSTTQGSYSVALGYQAGGQLQGNYAVAIGPNAGAVTQPPNSIMLNASASQLNGTNSGFYVNPVRNDDTSTSQQLFYNQTTNEITYSALASPVGVNQTWQSPTRSVSTVYQNTTGSPIMVIVGVASSSYAAQVYCDTSSVPSTSIAYAPTGQYASFTFIVPNGFYYSVVSSNSQNSWKELR